MSIDLTGFRADTDALLTDWGESVDIWRLTIDYDTVPPTETWADSTLDATMEIQPISGNKFRHDAGVLVDATHWGLTTYNSGIIVGDRLYRAGDTDYYDVLRADQLEDHTEIWMKYVQGAV